MNNKIIFTSNYARKGGDSRSIAISRKFPDWYEGKFMKELAPTWEMIMSHKNNEITYIDFIKHYIYVLKQRKITPQWLVEVLPDHCFLLCYESPSDFCHRHILAEWINKNTNIKVEEWKNDQEQQYEQHKNNVEKLIEF